MSDGDDVRYVYVHPEQWRALPGSMRTRRLRKKRMKALGKSIGVDMSAWWRRPLPPREEQP